MSESIDELRAQRDILLAACRAWSGIIAIMPLDYPVKDTYKVVEAQRALKEALETVEGQL